MQLSTALALLAAAGAAFAQTFSINTPTTSIIACVPLQIQWQGGQGPYTLAVHTYANNAVGDVVDTAQGLSGTSYTYHPKASEAGQQLEFQLTDSTGATAQSGATPKVADNPQCSGSSGGASSSGASSPSSSSGAGGSSSSGSASASSSAAASGSGSASSQPSSGSASSASATSSSHSSAGSLRVPAAVAGVVGLAAAALL